MKHRLTDLQPHEVSLVNRAANKRRFLALKSEGGATVNEVFEALLETEAENESDFLGILKSDGVEGEDANTLLAAYRLINGHRESVSPETFGRLTDVMGFAVEKSGDGDGNSSTEGDEAPIMKADGTPDFDRIEDEKVRGVVEALFKAQKAKDVENTELRQRLEKAEDVERQREFIQKAEELPFIPSPEGEDVPEGMGTAEMLMGIATKATEEYAALDSVLTAVNEMISKSEIFKSYGAVGAMPSSVEAEVTSKAKALVQKGDQPNLDKAKTIVMEQDPELQKRYLEEQRNG